MVVLARHLPRERMGEYFFAFTVAAFFALLGELASTKYLSRVVSEEPGRATVHLGRVLSLRVPLLLAAWVLLVVVMGSVRADVLAVVALAGFVLVLTELYSSFAATFVGLRRMKLRFVTGLLGHVGVLLVVLVGVRLGASLPRILLGYVAAHLAGLAVAWGALRLRIGAVRLDWDPDDLRALLRASWPFFLLTVLALVQFKVDTIMLFGLASATAVAAYEAAYKLFEVSRMAVRPLQLIFFPLAARYVVAGDVAALRRLARSLVLGSTSLGLVATLAVLAAAPVVVPLVWGDRYVDAVPVLRILYLTVVPLYVGFVCSFLAYALHLERPTLAILSVALVANVGLNLVAIPRMGPAGAAWTTLATETFLALALLLLVHRHLRNPGLAPTGPADAAREGPATGVRRPSVPSEAKGSRSRAGGRGAGGAS